MNNSYTGILHVYFYKIKGNVIHEIIENEKNGKDRIKSIYYPAELPDFYINPETNKIESSNLTFENIGKDQELIFVDFCSGDTYIAHLLHEIGIDDLFSFSDFEFDEEAYKRITVNEFEPPEFPVPTVFKLKETYYTSREGEVDSDTEIDFINVNNL